jgi:hypothetical protein
MTMANQQTQKDTPEAKVEHIAGTVQEAADRVADTARRTAGDAVSATRELTGAFTTSYGAFAEGIQELQHGYWRIVQNSFDIATSAPAEMMRCRNMTQLSELQREIFSKYLDGVVDANKMLIDVTARVAETAARPLHGQAGLGAH